MVSPVGGVGFRPVELANPKGAEWIGHHIPPLLEKLNCPTETYQLLDFYHATEHLQVFADNAFSKETERKKWFKQTRSALKKGKINSIIQEMNKLSLEFTGESRKNLDREINYFLKGNKEGRFNYHKISSLKLPIGSGEAVRCGGSPRCSNCRTRRVQWKV